MSSTIPQRPPISRLAKRLMIGYAIPLCVVVIAGLLAPMYLWVSLERYRVEYDARLDFYTRCIGLRSAAIDYRDTVQGRTRTIPSGSGRNKEDARFDYRMRSVGIQQWLEDNKDPSLALEITRIDQLITDYFRLTGATSKGAARTIAFNQIQVSLDQLVSLVGHQRDLELISATRADVFRTAAFVIFPTLAILLALYIGRILAYSLTKPLIGLTKAAFNIETMGADERLLDVSLDPPNEIGDLRQAIRNMATAILRRETELVTRNQSLDTATRRMESVLNTTEDGIAFIDSAGIFTLINAPFSHILDVDSDALLGHHFLTVAGTLFRKLQDVRQVTNKLRELNRDPHTNLQMTVYVGGPTVRTIQVTSAGVRGEPLSGTGLVWVGRIITLRDITKEVEADRMKTEFVATVSHELRTPLSAIKGYLDIMVDGQTGPLTPTQKEFLSLAGQSTDRLTTLINDILDISRVEAGGIRLRRVPTDYPPLVIHVVQMLAGQAKAKNISLGIQIANSNPWVEGDKDRISQVLFNLISNAIKYTPSNGTVKVKVTANQQNVTTQIVDTGAGISPIELTKVFERFYRADNSSTRESGGTGLGLAISKALVERMGGTVSLSSIVGKGTTFTVVFKRSLSTDLADHHTDDETMRLYLIVDGDPITRQELSISLRGNRNAVSAATTTNEALRRARGLRPDCIFIAPFSRSIDACVLISALRESTLTAKMPIILTGIASSALLVPVTEESAILHAIQSVRGNSEALIVIAGNQALVENISQYIPEALTVSPGKANQLPEFPVNTSPPILVLATLEGGVQMSVDANTLINRLPSDTVVILVGDVWKGARPASSMPGARVSVDQITLLASQI